MSRPKSLPLLDREQRVAADPAGHVWLSASAGSGKTQVLTARVLRLLLGGAAPESILCLTFTKAGAAEMANRLGDRLAQWVRMSDAALATDLRHLGEAFDLGSVGRARTLFARVIEAPGGLRIQTIHGFAQTLLAAFPIEAGIAPGFTAIEGRAEKELARRTLAELVSRAEERGDAQLLADLEALSLRLGEQDATAYLMDAAAAGEAIAALGDPATFEAMLRGAMGVPDGRFDEVLAARCSDFGFDCDALKAALDANRSWGTKTGLEFAAVAERWLAADPRARAAMIREAAQLVLTKAERAAKQFKAGLLKADPGYEAYHAALVAEFSELLRWQIADELARLQAAGLRAGAAFGAAYAAAKRTAGVADFDDLIRWTRRLFADRGVGEWVRFKLDSRIDHVLVDEAQDTNDDQWQIVDALAEEYFHRDLAAEARHRTLFMVGDTKQAIYRFQGTDPRSYQAYGEGKRALAADLAAAAEAADPPFCVPPFRKLSISQSFRSAPAVLDLVDGLIDDIGAGAMGLAEAAPPHRAFNDRRPGRVEVWPPFVAEGAEEEEGEEGWIGEPARRYAEHVARRIKAMIDEAPLMASTGRPLSAGDILILVRSRSEASALIVARLFALGVPVAGIDRLLLSRPLAVKDLLSAIRFAVQPLDDLNLAGLLVSPLLGWDQQRLYDLAYPRGEKEPLWDALRRDPAHGATVAMLGGLLAMADYVSPARFLETILSGPMAGRARLIARLGEEARDPIEELLGLALAFEQQEAATLDRFLAWFEAGDVEIKRDSAAAGDAVRVMTVHGAKGLEAPMVVLADATFNPADKGKGARSFAAPIDGRDVPLLRPAKKELIAPWLEIIEGSDALDREEHWRLLYVAVTRAAERLIVTGLAPGRGELSADSWHARCAAALMALGAAPAGEAANDAGLIWTGRGASDRPRERRGKYRVPALPLPDWARAPAPAEAVPPRPLSPSSLGEDRDALPPPSPAMREAAQRGTWLHALFERLPALAPALRRERALAWLAGQGADAPVAREIADAALAVIADEAFADLFAPEALAEAPIAATLPDGRVIAGTVDRLCIGEELVRVIDFKTGRFVPGSAAEVPAGHARQMAAYAEALRVIFPGRRVEAALLYTHGPRLVTLDG